MSTYANNRLNQITRRSVAPYVDVLGVANPTTNVTVRVVGGTTYTAARNGEYFHHALNVPNSTAQYPSVEVKSLYGATQAETNKVFVAAATESPTYDADGNLTQDGRWTYTWDGENRLIQMIRDTDNPTGARQKLVFEYDHQGRRIRKTLLTYSSGWQEQADLIFLYDGWNLVAELDANASNAKVRTYVWGTDLSGTMTGAGGVGGLLWLNNHQSTFEGKTLPTGVQYAAYDGNGNVAALVKASDGSVTARYDYGPFAEPIRASGPMAKANPIRFSTKYTDYQSGLLYYGFRYYGPAIGRWPSRDPIGERGGASLYRITNNNLEDHIDAMGLQTASLPVQPILSPPFSSQESACQRFDDWYQKEKADLAKQPNWLSGLPPCPCYLAMSCRPKYQSPKGAQQPWSPVPSLMEGWTFDPIVPYHPGAKWCIRSKSSAAKSSQQCCYDGRGKLITHGPGAGTPDKKAPGHGHRENDVDPYKWAVQCDGGKPGENAAKYLEVRPPNNGNGCEKHPPEQVVRQAALYDQGPTEFR